MIKIKMTFYINDETQILKYSLQVENNKKVKAVTILIYETAL